MICSVKTGSSPVCGFFAALRMTGRWPVILSAAKNPHVTLHTSAESPGKKCLTSFVACAIIRVSRKVNHLISIDWMRLSVV